jgi:ankyrin repeat protein
MTQAGVNVLDGEARTPLINSVIAQKEEVFSWLLSNGADIDHQDRIGWTALYYAVGVGRLDFVIDLLRRGANIHLTDIYGNTALWRAAFEARGEYELVERLLSYKANPNWKNKSDRSPLDMARTLGDKTLIALFEAAVQVPDIAR